MRNVRFWLISLVSFVSILLGTTIFPVLSKMPETPAISLPQNAGEIVISKPSTIAFKPNLPEQGHEFITRSTLTGPWSLPGSSPVLDEDGNPMGFTSAAIEEIYQANRGVDLKPGSDLRTSEDFDIPQNHFDPTFRS